MPSWIVCLIAEIDRWQTLLTGLIAIVVAGWTIRPLREQITLQRAQIETEEKRRREADERLGLAIRAQMPDALGQLSAYARACGEYLTSRQDILPSIPTESLRVLQGTIEHIDSNVGAAVFELISFVQVQSARLLSSGSRRRASRFPDQIYDATKLHALTDRLYPYARNEEQGKRVETLSQKLMLSSLRNVVGLAQFMSDETRYAAIVEMINRRHS